MWVGPLCSGHLGPLSSFNSHRIRTLELILHEGFAFFFSIKPKVLRDLTRWGTPMFGNVTTLVGLHVIGNYRTEA